MRLDAGNLDRQRTRRKLLINRDRPQFQHRRHRQHNRNERDKPQHAQPQPAEPASQRSLRQSTNAIVSATNSGRPAGSRCCGYEISDQQLREQSARRPPERAASPVPSRLSLRCFEVPPQIICQQHGSCRDSRKNVSGKLRLRNRKEHDRHDQPAAGKQAELQFEIRVGWRQISRPAHQTRTDSTNAAITNTVHGTSASAVTGR